MKGTYNQSNGNGKEDTSSKENGSTASDKDFKPEEKNEINYEGGQYFPKAREQGTIGILRSDSGTSFRRATFLFSSHQVKIFNIN